MVVLVVREGQGGEGPTTCWCPCFSCCKKPTTLKKEKNHNEEEEQEVIDRDDNDDSESDGAEEFQNADKDFVGQEIMLPSACTACTTTGDHLSNDNNNPEIPDVFTKVKMKVSTRTPHAEGQTSATRHSETYGKKLLLRHVIL